MPLVDAETTLQEARSKLLAQDYPGVSRLAPVMARLRDDDVAPGMPATSR